MENDLASDLPDLSFLTEEEKLKIIQVLQRDDSLRQKQNEKTIKLKEEIEILEAGSLDIPSEHIETANNCVRCKQVFGYFFNTGEFCPQCGYKVCQKCKINQTDCGVLFKNRDKPIWFCILCHKYNEYMVHTGEWIHLQENRVKRNSTDRSRSISSNDTNLSKNAITGSQIIKLSLFPSKKTEILNELDVNNFKKSTLKKRYSTVKKAHSQNLVDNDIEYDTYQAKTYSNVTTPVQGRSSSMSRSPNDAKNDFVLRNQTNIINNSSNKYNFYSLGRPLVGPQSPIDLKSSLKNNNNNNASEKSPKTPKTNESIAINNDIQSTVKAISSMFKFGSNENSASSISSPTSPTSVNSSLSTASKNVKNLQFNENVSEMTSNFPKSTSSNSKPLKLDISDDLISVTSSELDNESSRSDLTNTFKSKSNSGSLNPNSDKTINSHEQQIYSKNSKSNSIDEAMRNSLRDELDNSSNTQSSYNKNRQAYRTDLNDIFNREKSPSTKSKASSKSGISFNSKQSYKSNLTKKDDESDSEMVQMDQIFASAIESLKINKNPNSRLVVDANNNDLSKHNRKSPNVNSVSTTTTDNSIDVLSKESMGDVVENEYLKAQKAKNEYMKSSRHSPIHLSLIKKAKANYERATSVQSALDDSTLDLNMQIRGRIMIKLFYEKKSSNLSVTICRCENLASVNSKKETCDPYAKIYLLPGSKDKNNKRKTLSKKNCCNPEFNETFRYVIAYSDLNSHTLWVSVWHKDTFGRNKFLGEIHLPLSSDLVNENAPKWYELGKKET